MAESEEPVEDPIVSAIGEHVTKHIGPVANVFQERAFEGVQIDVMIIPPGEERDYLTLVTCGMSERPMRVPLENPEDLGLLPELRHAELLLCLPSDWPFSHEAFQAEENYWPIRWLKKIARLPHRQDAWLGLGHTVPNGDPPVRRLDGGPATDVPRGSRQASPARPRDQLLLNRPAVSRGNGPEAQTGQRRPEQAPGHRPGDGVNRRRASQHREVNGLRIRPPGTGVSR